MNTLIVSAVDAVREVAEANERQPVSIGAAIALAVVLVASIVIYNKRK